MTRDDALALGPVADALEALGVKYYIGGSVASSTHGVGRSTQDIDVVADLAYEHVTPFVARLLADYYIDATMVQEAIRERSSFNVLHHTTMYKIDVFVPKSRPFDRNAWSRIVRVSPFEGDDREFPVSSAEEAVLSKLEWYRLGGETSERQWSDVIGVMKVQGDALDREYLRKWAAELDVSDLLDRALRESRLG